MANRVRVLKTDYIRYYRLTKAVCERRNRLVHRILLSPIKPLLPRIYIDISYVPAVMMPCNRVPVPKVSLSNGEWVLTTAADDSLVRFGLQLSLNLLDIQERKEHDAIRSYANEYLCNN
jgi:hypothetical protein